MKISECSFWCYYFLYFSHSDKKLYLFQNRTLIWNIKNFVNRYPWIALHSCVREPKHPCDRSQKQSQAIRLHSVCQPYQICLIMKQTQTVRNMIIISIWEFSNYTASLITQIPPHMYCTSTSKKGSRPTAVVSLVCGTEYCFFPFSWWSTGWFTKAAFCMQQCPYKIQCALLSALSESENRVVEKKKIIVWPISVILYQREVKSWTAT